MDDFLTKLIAKGEAKGEAKIIQGLIEAGKMTVEQIAEILKFPVSEVEKLANMELA